MTTATPIKPMLVFARNHVHVKTPFCGDLVEILREHETVPDIAVLVDVRPTIAHYHKGFDEAYFVLDGALTVQLFDPVAEETTEDIFREHEVCVIPKGVHHRITAASFHNRLCVLCAPHFDFKDENPSDRL